MGVDPKLFARIKGQQNWMSDAHVRDLAVRLAAALGHERFTIITPGHGFSWHPDGRHALSIETETVSARLAEIAEYDDKWASEERQRLSLADPSAIVITQDGPTIILGPDEQVVEAHLMSRYYGIGYERGDWPTIRAVAEFLELHIPGCAIWYGGDSSGVCAEPFGPAAREALNRHYLSVGHTPYRSHFGSFRGTPAPHCSFCVADMQNSGGGGSEDFWFCEGCGQKTVTEDGVRHDLKPHADFFKWRDSVVVK